MKPIMVGLVSVLLATCSSGDELRQQVNLTEAVKRPATKWALWYRSPAKDWGNEALPIGNSRLGGMVFGGIAQEHIQFNEKTLWSGGPGEVDGYNAGIRPGAVKHLPVARRLIHEGKFEESRQYIRKHFQGDRRGFGSNQTFGDIWVELAGHQGEVKDYRRELNLEDAIARVSYEMAGVRYTREYFCSYPDQVMVLRFGCSEPGGLSLSVKLSTPHQEATVRSQDRKLVMRGKVAGNGMQFDSRLQICNQGGTVRLADDRIEVAGANTLTMLLSAATDYQAKYPTYKGDDPAQRVQEYLSKAAKKSYDQLRRIHVADYQNLYQRVSLDLGEDERVTLPTDERVASYPEKPDTQLESLIFQYGRYLLISSSRPGDLPAHLQGVWNDLTKPTWECDYHFDINIQMV